MRRRISLYIGNNKADINEQDLILFNYTMEDLKNPTIVKNSYSQQITLKGTPNNNIIFGFAYQLDRVVGNGGGSIGADFNPSVKLPFEIYNEMNEILESGYCKLERVVRKGADIDYQVTLYGGLGSFLYSLSYDANGNKRTLADLEYLNTGNAETELDFTINADSVSAAWATDTYDDNIDSKWKVINFAPAYNGIPSNFSANKAIAIPSNIGLSANYQDPESKQNYTPKSGYTLVTLAEEQDEWAIKDLRSYLQRPVFSLYAFWKAIARPENNGGYNVDAAFLSAWEYNSYSKLWMTLPMLTSLTAKQVTGTLSATLSSTETSSKQIARWNLSESVESNVRVTANLSARLKYKVAGSALSSLSLSAYTKEGQRTLGKNSIIILQALAYTSEGTLIGGSKVKVISDLAKTPADLANLLDYSPLFALGEETYETATINNTEFILEGEYYTYQDNLSFEVNANGVAYYTLHTTAYLVDTIAIERNINIVSISGGNSSLATLFAHYMTSFDSAGAMVGAGEGDKISTTTGETLRSGAHITKEMLLSNSNTPADYLLSFCKMFGLHILSDKATKTIRVLTRNQLYNYKTIDITKRVDLSFPLNVKPYVFDGKWYEFSPESAGGAYVDEYKDVYGVNYGDQRVNTGYDFDAQTTNLMSGNLFKSAATILAKSKYFNYILAGSSFRPSQFAETGNTYVLWDSTGEAKELPVTPINANATITYYNEDYNGYDINQARKLDFRDKDNKPIDGSGVLLFHEGTNTYPYFKLSDDLAVMDLLNEGTPCWILDPGTAQGVAVPIFQRYKYGDVTDIVDSLDFGIPREVNIPNVHFYNDNPPSLYHRFWQHYLTDRFDVNTKVLTCRVDFSGMQVSQELLRNFYWYDNSLWVLNAIRNYSMTTYDAVECEFIQVQNIENYLNGQYA